MAKTRPFLLLFFWPETEVGMRLVFINSVFNGQLYTMAGVLARLLEVATSCRAYCVAIIMWNHDSFARRPQIVLIPCLHCTAIMLPL